MSLTCYIIDDEPLAIEVIKAYVSQVPFLSLKGTFDKPTEGLQMITTHPVDVIFLDIEMPVINGISLLKSLKNSPKVIFTTAYRNYAMESYELDVIDYLLKPIAFPRFLKAVNKCVETLDLTQQQGEACIYVNSNKKFIKINFNDIQYIESAKDYIKINTINGTIITKTTLSSFITKLTEKFIRVHRSFVINRTYITAFTAKDIEIEHIEIPIGDSYKEEVYKQLKDT